MTGGSDKPRKNRWQKLGLRLEDEWGEQVGAALLAAIKADSWSKIEEVFASVDSEEQAMTRLGNKIGLEQDGSMNVIDLVSYVDEANGKIELAWAITTHCGPRSMYESKSLRIRDLLQIAKATWLGAEIAIANKLIPSLMDAFNKKQDRIHRGRNKPKFTRGDN